jgi:hypothetical protein
VCGNEAGNCGRTHTGHTRFAEGWYKTTLRHGGQFVDGVVGTCVSLADYEANVLQEGKARSEDVANAGAQLIVDVDLDVAPETAEEGDYLMAKEGYAGVVN